MPENERKPHGSGGQPRRGDEKNVPKPEDASLEQQQRDRPQGRDRAPSHPQRSEKSPWLGGG